MPLRPTALFYLGLFPIVLLLWAWADSLTHTTQWEKVTGPDTVILVFAAYSELHFYRYRPEDRSPDLKRIWDDRPLGRFSRDDISRDPLMPLFPLPESRGGRESKRRVIYTTKLTTAPFWLILAAYLPLWLTLSGWHARRKQKRLLASLPSPPPAQPQTDLDLRV